MADLREGLSTHDGRLVYEGVAQAHGLPFQEAAFG